MIYVWHQALDIKCMLIIIIKYLSSASLQHESRARPAEQNSVGDMRNMTDV